mmetsp:Transcript_29438/g.62496  ORF Transcript_29438/g.62496 Transcript_29438/m.62496 type:complete len:104 (-) Transcript_29438:19-330(-)
MTSLKYYRPTDGSGNGPELIGPNSKFDSDGLVKSGGGCEGNERTAKFGRPCEEEGRGCEDGYEYGVESAWSCHCTRYLLCFNTLMDDICLGLAVGRLAARRLA